MPTPPTDRRRERAAPPTATWGDARPRPWASERAVWGAAVVAAALDVALTAHGLGAGYGEANPVARAALAALGPAALVGLKLLALVVAALCSRLLPRGARPTLPAILAATWGVAALYNGLLLA
jgi:hypothetical protein